MDSLTELAARADCELLSPPVHGGSASVHRARCRRRNILVALKVLHPGRDPRRLRNEARTLSRLDHPSIVRPVRSGAVDGVPYLMTTWVDGVPSSHLPGSPADVAMPGLSLERSVRLLSSVVDALAHAHARRIVHGDLTPSNVLVTPRDDIVLIDFGCGHEVDDVTLTAHDDLVGTPRYLAPELIRGASPSALGDQYAAALLGYELLTGHWPFASRSSIAAAALHHQLYTEPTPISEHRPDLPVGLDGVFDKALAKRPEDRYPDLSAFHDALMRRSARPANAVRVGGPASTSRATRRDDVDERPTSRSMPSRPREWRSVPGLGALCLCGIGMVPSNSWLASTDALETPDGSRSSGAVMTGTGGSRDHASPSPTAVASVDGDDHCNRYPNPGFDAALEPNFYRDPDNRAAATRADARSGDGSPSLQLGTTDVYGLYGIIVDVEGGRDYGFGASLFFEGYVHRADLQVLWLDASWQTIEGATAATVIADKSDGRHVLSPIRAPADAHYAVPTLYKDASAGTLHADDVVFAHLDGICDESIGKTRS